MMQEKASREEECQRLLLEVNVGMDNICSGQDPPTRCRPRVQGRSLLLLLALLASPQNTRLTAKGAASNTVLQETSRILE